MGQRPSAQANRRATEALREWKKQRHRAKITAHDHPNPVLHPPPSSAQDARGPHRSAQDAGGAGLQLWSGTGAQGEAKSVVAATVLTDRYGGVSAKPITPALEAEGVGEGGGMQRVSGVVGGAGAGAGAGGGDEERFDVGATCEDVLVLEPHRRSVVKRGMLEHSSFALFGSVQSEGQTEWKV